MKDKEQSLAAEVSSEESLEQLLREELDKKQPDREIVLSILETLEHGEAEPSKSATKKAKAPYWLWRTAIAAIVVLSLIFIAPPVFGAESIFVLVGRWTMDLFALESGNLQTEYAYNTDHLGLQQLYNSVAEQGIAQKVVPMWLPPECNLSDMSAVTALNGVSLYAEYSNNCDYVIFTLCPAWEDLGKKYPKDDVEVIIREVEGIKHYLVANEGLWSAVWVTDTIACSIITTYDYETICKIIDSIYLEEL